ncbi:hypothetical protein ES708_18272 [subsurface metagenome]
MVMESRITMYIDCSVPRPSPVLNNSLAILLQCPGGRNESSFSFLTNSSVFGRNPSGIGSRIINIVRSSSALFEYTNRFSHASLGRNESTTPTTLAGEQEIFYILSGTGTITAGGKTADIHEGSTILMPANLEFTIHNSGDTTMTMYLVNEPIPDGFRPNEEMLIRDELSMPIASYTGHWCHIVKYLFETKDGLGSLERILTVSIDPMQIAHPHSHSEGTEEVWTGISGESLAWIGKEIRLQGPGTGYMVPADGKTPHANINESNERIKMFYFARYKDHEVRK